MHAAHWQAPTAEIPVDATVALPGSKSMTNRALVLAALSEEESVLRGPLRSRDSLLMAAGLRELGTGIDDQDTDWRIRPGVSRGGGPCGPGGDASDSKADQPRRGSSSCDSSGQSAGHPHGGGKANLDDGVTYIDVGNAGTVMRFLPPVAALARGDVAFDGDSRARERPLAPLIHGLRALGADIDGGERGTVPLTVRGRGRLGGGPLTLDASLSSQLVSGLLLAAPRFDKGIELRHEGPPLPSEPHVAMTVAMLRDAGAEVETAPDTWRVPASPLRAGVIDIEPDLSNAAPFLSAALVTAGEVRIPGWPVRTTQPGAELRELLEAMGATTETGGQGLAVHGTGRIRGIDADLRHAGELAPTLAAVAALADSPSRIRGIAHLRRHETDRLDALTRELRALGGDVTQTSDGLDIRPRPLHGGIFHTYDDHRLATAAAVIGLAVPGIEVENVATTGKTLPAFPERWEDMLGVSTGAAH